MENKELKQTIIVMTKAIKVIPLVCFLNFSI